MTAKGSVHGRIRSHVITRSRVKRESLAQKCTSLANQCLCALKSDRLLEALLSATIHTAVDVGAIKKSELERVIVDTTVQEKAIAHPVDSRLLEIARRKVVAAAKRCGMALKQAFVAEGKTLAAPGGRLRPCQTVQAPQARGQTSAHHSWNTHSRDQTQDTEHRR